MQSFCSCTAATIHQTQSPLLSGSPFSNATFRDFLQTFYTMHSTWFASTHLLLAVAAESQPHVVLDVLGAVLLAVQLSQRRLDALLRRVVLARRGRAVAERVTWGRVVDGRLCASCFLASVIWKFVNVYTFSSFRSENLVHLFVNVWLYKVIFYQYLGKILTWRIDVIHQKESMDHKVEQCYWEWFP